MRPVMGGRAMEFCLFLGIWVLGILLACAVVLLCVHVAGMLAENEGVPTSVIVAARKRFSVSWRRDCGTQSRIHTKGDAIQDDDRCCCQDLPRMASTTQQPGM